MMQESVYVKMAINTTVAKGTIKKVKDNKPPEGLVFLLSITEEQFSRIEYISGEFKSNIISDTSKLLIL